nr:Rv3654c family TadE-like protein [Thermomonospora umbrina]
MGRERGHGRGRGRGDRGAGTIWVLAFMALIWVFGVAVLTAGGVRVARHRAHAAADLAALAAAATAGEGQQGACRQAAQIAEGAGGRLASCVVQGALADVRVAMTVRLPAPLGRVRLVSRARAGPQTQALRKLDHQDIRCTKCQ